MSVHDAGPRSAGACGERAWPGQHGGAGVEAWLGSVRARVGARLVAEVRERCAEQVRDMPGAEAFRDALTGFVTGGKRLRSLFLYLGWRCGARDGADDGAVLGAGVSMELLHAFALLQDDVMDESALRRGSPTVHRRLAAWHAAQGLSGSSRRFGESAAVLLADLCLVWSEQTLRDSGLGAEALRRGWPCFDRMRTHLGAGQLADLVNDLRGAPTARHVLGVARRKSGDYSVRDPLRLGATLAGCDEAVLDALGRYGTALGEAFQLRDDLIGALEPAAVTGKSCGDDLVSGKATTVVVLAREKADAGQRARWDELAGTDAIGTADVHRWQRLIVETGAAAVVEEMIAARVRRARSVLADARLDPAVTAGLGAMAARCTDRAR